MKKTHKELDIFKLTNLFTFFLRQQLYMSEANSYLEPTEDFYERQNSNILQTLIKCASDYKPGVYHEKIHSSQDKSSWIIPVIV